MRRDGRRARRLGSSGAESSCLDSAASGRSSIPACPRSVLQRPGRSERASTSRGPRVQVPQLHRGCNNPCPLTVGLRGCYWGAASVPRASLRPFSPPPALLRRLHARPASLAARLLPCCHRSRRGRWHVALFLLCPLAVLEPWVCLAFECACGLGRSVRAVAHGAEREGLCLPCNTSFGAGSVRVASCSWMFQSPEPLGNPFGANAGWRPGSLSDPQLAALAAAAQLPPRTGFPQAAASQCNHPQIGTPTSPRCHHLRQAGQAPAGQPWGGAATTPGFQLPPSGVEGSQRWPRGGALHQALPAMVVPGGQPQAPLCGLGVHGRVCNANQLALCSLKSSCPATISNLKSLHARGCGPCSIAPATRPLLSLLGDGYCALRPQPVYMKWMPSPFHYLPAEASQLFQGFICYTV